MTIISHAEETKDEADFGTKLTSPRCLEIVGSLWQIIGLHGWPWMAMGVVHPYLWRNPRSALPKLLSMSSMGTQRSSLTDQCNFRQATDPFGCVATPFPRRIFWRGTVREANGPSVFLLRLFKKKVSNLVQNLPRFEDSHRAVGRLQNDGHAKIEQLLEKQSFGKGLGWWKWISPNHTRTGLVLENRMYLSEVFIGGQFPHEAVPVLVDPV